MSESGRTGKEEITKKLSGEFRSKLYLVYVKKTNADMKRKFIESKSCCIIIYGKNIG
ncbi:MAG: hypothetical protein ACE14Q_03415 [Acidobacteriota bacterium]